MFWARASYVFLVRGVWLRWLMINQKRGNETSAPGWRARTGLLLWRAFGAPVSEIRAPRGRAQRSPRPKQALEQSVRARVALS